MSKVAIIYFSGTGNTEIMANNVCLGAKSVGSEVEVFKSCDFDCSTISNYDAFAFGCPSMGAEQLEDGEFEPMWLAVKDAVAGKNVVLFGSYGWGSGEWMDTWAQEANVSIDNTFICEGAPDSDGEQKCFELGAKLV